MRFISLEPPLNNLLLFIHIVLDQQRLPSSLSLSEICEKQTKPHSVQVIDCALVVKPFFSRLPFSEILTNLYEGTGGLKIRGIEISV